MGAEMTHIHLVKLIPNAAVQNLCTVDDSFQLAEIHNSAYI
jgi:hypothetical protein